MIALSFSREYSRRGRNSNPSSGRECNSSVRRLLMVRISLLLVWISLAASAEQPKPQIDSPEGRRAFDDLGKFYANEKMLPPFEEALAALKKDDAPGRKKAGEYLLALFRQSTADETNGRSEWRRLP